MPLIQQLRTMALLQIQTAGGVISYRQSGQGASLVLLHGIGSASGSWLHQLQDAPAGHQVLAWDAPGYGQSQHLSQDQPSAQDYAVRLWQWLDAVSLHPGPITLVGHSLGALMAAAAAQMRPQSVAQLVLLSPAQGYGQASAEIREAKLNDRLAMLAQWGPVGLAKERGKAMLSAHAKPDQLSHVQHLMAAIDPRGYTQAAHMLAHDDLLQRLSGLTCPIRVASGSADTITPQASCQALAKALGCPHWSLGDVGHACAIEAPEAVLKAIIGVQP